MTDRFKGFVVTLDHEVREDDAEAIITALKMVKGVIDVQPVMDDYDDHMNRERVRYELERKILKALHPPKNK